MREKEGPGKVLGSVDWDDGPFHVTREWYRGHYSKLAFFGGDQELADRSGATVLCVKGWTGKETMVEWRSIRPVAKIKIVWKKRD